MMFPRTTLIHALRGSNTAEINERQFQNGLLRRVLVDSNIIFLSRGETLRRKNFCFPFVVKI